MCVRLQAPGNGKMEIGDDKNEKMMKKVMAKNDDKKVMAKL